MEELLNILCEKGWKPFGKDQKFEIWIETLPYKKIRVCLKKPDYDYYVYSYRDLVSKESWLWQFVCENGMLKKRWEYRAKRRCLHWWEHDEDVYYDTSYTKNDYEYFIIESALCDEDKLEEFLLDNIKVE